MAKGNRKQGGGPGGRAPGAAGEAKSRSGNPAVRASARQPAGRPKGSRRAAGATSGGRGAAATPRRRLPPGETLYSPGAGPTRRRIERASAPVVVYLHQLPRLMPIAILLVLLVLGALLPPAFAAHRHRPGHAVRRVVVVPVLAGRDDVGEGDTGGNRRAPDRLRDESVPLEHLSGEGRRRGRSEGRPRPRPTPRRLGDRPGARAAAVIRDGPTEGAGTYGDPRPWARGP